MASNAFGDVVKLTVFGESHGVAVGGVIDGFPAGFALDLEEIQRVVETRRPGRSPWVSPRKEPDQVEWLSGLLDGKTTGAPIAFILRNVDAHPSAYGDLNKVWRPGHAQWTYFEKYGCVDSSGGGRSSARETAVRVVAGAIAQQWLTAQGVIIGAEIGQIGGIEAKACSWPSIHQKQRESALGRLRKVFQDPLFCAEPETSLTMQAMLQQLVDEGDSIGAIVRGWVVGMSPGWGDPIAHKLHADLAAACLSLPACKGFEIGEGFAAAFARGSAHNDAFIQDDQGGVSLATNHAGGLLGGITTGAPLLIRTVFKPTSSIRKTQNTCTREGIPCTMTVGKQGRHDPCVGIRAVPVVMAVMAWTILNAALRHRLSRMEF